MAKKRFTECSKFRSPKANKELEYFRLAYPTIDVEEIAETLLVFNNRDVLHFIFSKSEIQGSNYSEFRLAKRMACSFARSFLKASYLEQQNIVKLSREQYFISKCVNPILTGYSNIPIIVACILNNKVSFLHFSQYFPYVSFQIQDINDFIQYVISPDNRGYQIFTYGGHNATIQ